MTDLETAFEETGEQLDRIIKALKREKKETFPKKIHAVISNPYNEWTAELTDANTYSVLTVYNQGLPHINIPTFCGRDTGNKYAIIMSPFTIEYEYDGMKFSALSGSVAEGYPGGFTLLEWIE